MQTDEAIAQVRQTLAKFQDGYTARDVAKLDEFMQLFVQGEDAELIGVGAASRGGNEWFQGLAAIREIVESDWLYWGNVILDVEGARITARGETAWLSTTGKLIATQERDKALEFYLRNMKELLEQEGASLDERLMEATHYGMRRLRERQKELGYGWPFTLTAVLVKDQGAWRFHTIHWAMPVD
jgi:hypothetical protein